MDSKSCLNSLNSEKQTFSTIDIITKCTSDASKSNNAGKQGTKRLKSAVPPEYESGDTRRKIVWLNRACVSLNLKPPGLDKLQDTDKQN